MSNSSDKNAESNIGEQNENKTSNDRMSRAGEQSTELGSKEKFFKLFSVIAGINEITGIEPIVSNNSIPRLNSSRSNHFFSYPLQPQHNQISINAEERVNNNININNINQDDSGLLFGLDDYYNENENNNYDELINPLFQQLQQNPGMTIDTLILNLNSIINNEK